jgi:predicted nucleic acid-binding protein
MLILASFTRMRLKRFRSRHYSWTGCVCCGITVRKTIDVMIATFCIENGFELLHNDRDFDPMEERLGLKIRRS